MIVAEVPAARLHEVWPRVLPHLEAALARGHGEMDSADVRERIAAGEWRLLIATAPGVLAGFAVFGVVDWPRARHLWCFYAGGERGDDALAAMLPAARVLAREGRCARVFWRGRPGWLRRVPGAREAGRLQMMEV